MALSKTAAEKGLIYPVGIGGIGGSGTRLVAEMLAESGYFLGNDLNSAWDNPWWTFLFQRPELWGNEEEFSELYRWFFSAMNGDRMELRPPEAEKLQQLTQDRTGLDAQWLASCLRQFYRQLLHGNEGAQRPWAWKAPHTPIFLDYLYRAQPGFKYIHIIRHGLDMAWSSHPNQFSIWAKNFLSEENLEESPRNFLKYWGAIHRRILEISQQAGEKQFLLLDFDQLCLEPENEISRLLRFLELEPTAERIASLLQKVRPPTSIRRYQQHSLHPFDPEDIEFVKELGYRVENPPAMSGDPQLSLPLDGHKPSEPTPPAPVNPRKALVILGMHRSGTSVLTEALCKVGFAAPQTPLPPREDHPNGFRESEPVIAFNDRLLQAMGTSCNSLLNDPDAFKTLANQEAWYQEAEDLLNLEYPTDESFVIKDPRMCRLWPFWEQVLRRMNLTIRVILLARSPWEVAASLEKRNGLDYDRGVLLWLQHLVYAEIATRHVRRARITYDALLRAPKDGIKYLAQELDLELVENWETQLATVIQEDLRHHKLPAPPTEINPLLKQIVQDTYEAFLGGLNSHQVSIFARAEDLLELGGPLFLRDRQELDTGCFDIDDYHREALALSHARQRVLHLESQSKGVKDLAKSLLKAQMPQVEQESYKLWAWAKALLKLEHSLRKRRDPDNAYLKGYRFVIESPSDAIIENEEFILEGWFLDKHLHPAERIEIQWGEGMRQTAYPTGREWDRISGRLQNGNLSASGFYLKLPPRSTQGPVTVVAYPKEEDPVILKEFKKRRNSTSSKKNAEVTVLKNEKTIAQKILFVFHDFEYEGATLVMLDLVKEALRDSTIRPSVWGMRQGPLQEEFSRMGIDVKIISNYAEKAKDEFELEDGIAVLRKLLNTEQPDLVHINTLWGFPVILAAGQEYLRTIWNIHESEGVISFLTKTLNKECFIEHCQQAFAVTDRVIYASESTAVVYEAENCSNDIIIHNGLDTERLQIDKNNRENIRRSLGVGEEDILILMVGTICPRQCQDELVSALETHALKNAEYLKVILLGDVHEKYCDNLKKRIAESESLRNRIQILEKSSDVAKYYLAADIFVLTSQLESYPLILLEAMYFGLPIIANPVFGVREQVLDEVTGLHYVGGDINDLAEKISFLSNLKTQRQQLGKAGEAHLKTLEDRTQMLKRYHAEWKQVIPKPKVSIIVSSDNHAQQLDARLRSIFDQSFDDYELILIDNVSQDWSRGILAKWAHLPSWKPTQQVKFIRPRIKSSIFKTWISAMRAAKGDFVWIAEPGDTTEPEFLATLVQKLEENPDMQLAYCDSQSVDKETAVSLRYKDALRGLSNDHWQQDFISDGKQEVSQYLAIQNTISSVSAVVFRNIQDLHALEIYLNRFSFCGDWALYVYLLRSGTLGYINKPLNHHSIKRFPKSADYLNDILEIQEFVKRHYPIEDEMESRMTDYFSREQQLLIAAPEASSEQDPDRWQGGKILVVLSSLTNGEGENFGIRLANELSKRHDVTILSVDHTSPDGKIVSLIDPAIPLEHLPHEEVSDRFQELLQEREIEVIHSHIWWADKFVARNIGNSGVRWVVNMHGCYEMLLEKPDVDPHFQAVAKSIFQRANQIVYPADKNRRVLHRFPSADASKWVKMDYGLRPITQTRFTRQDLGIEEDAFVVVLAARAMEEKGWEPAIRGVLQMNQEPDKRQTHLLLLGNGPKYAEWRAQFESARGIHFLGQVKSSMEWMQISDVVLLPTWFHSEALPSSILEALVAERPVVASSVGEIPDMLRIGTDQPAGLILDFDKTDRVPAEEIFRKLSTLRDDFLLHKALGQNAGAAGERFSMERCLSQYEALFFPEKSSRNS